MPRWDEDLRLILMHWSLIKSHLMVTGLAIQYSRAWIREVDLEMSS